ncbi:hypothetical protein CI610_03198 [invertebrate metagenome]|uniref:Uncharacterized protein n=1 Tax=invertebrate metagenome TaxID=1711999 RepID=A0A2H9T3R7_9ZZZZ
MIDYKVNGYRNLYTYLLLLLIVLANLLVDKSYAGKKRKYEDTGNLIYPISGEYRADQQPVKKKKTHNYRCPDFFLITIS